MSDQSSNVFHTELAYAKINLALHIRARREDGYHTIDTVFAFVDDGDRLQATAASNITLQVIGPYAADLLDTRNNLVIRAAQLLQNHYKVEAGAAIILDKRLPVASGIGGGSADAAAAARILCRLWELPASSEQLAMLLEPLGADIPACIVSETVRGTGTGTILHPLDAQGISGTPVLLVNPNIAVATGAVFSRWSGKDSGALRGNTAHEMMLLGVNDLQPIAFSICPAISDVLGSLQSQSPLLARMSGSGATCFALFSNDADCMLAAQNIKSLYPNYWAMTGKLR